MHLGGCVVLLENFPDKMLNFSRYTRAPCRFPNRINLHTTLAILSQPLMPGLALELYAVSWFYRESPWSSCTPRHKTSNSSTWSGIFIILRTSTGEKTDAIDKHPTLIVDGSHRSSAEIILVVFFSRIVWFFLAFFGITIHRVRHRCPYLFLIAHTTTLYMYFLNYTINKGEKKVE